MKNRWDDAQARTCDNDLLKLRVYTSQLLGADQDLVMHGGGNTSVKISRKNLFGEEEEILYVKGSGWDLETIQAAGFSPVKLYDIYKLAELTELSDMEMVRQLRMALTDPSAPNPSVEAILHGIIPFTFVDHTHADAVVTISNTPDGLERIKSLYGKNMLIVPYVMPGFILARKIYEMTRGLDWTGLDGMILMNHGIFTFDQDAKKSYDKMIRLVGMAEDYLKISAKFGKPSSSEKKINPLELARIRKKIASVRGKAVLINLDTSEDARSFSQMADLKDACSKGPLTPDHIIRTKRIPLLIGEDIYSDIELYSQEYENYFKRNNRGEFMLDPAPRWAVMPGSGTLSIATGVKELGIIRDIVQHTRRAIVQAESMGGWVTPSEKELFDMEYWSLEQAKLKKPGQDPEFMGKVAIVTGAASGIGKACADSLIRHGSAVIALDISDNLMQIPWNDSVLAIQCDLTRAEHVQEAIERGIQHFGGIDLLISNAGFFPESQGIKDIDRAAWQASLEVNLTSHQQLLKYCEPFLSEGLDPAIVIIASKNVPAPGPGAASYSVAKAGLTQLGRIAAMEFGKKGIRVNMIHPNAVYDTALWTENLLKSRALHYGLSVEEYKRNNILGVEINSQDVANLALSMLGKGFAKVTGAQVPIDGGNERVI